MRLFSSIILGLSLLGCAAPKIEKPPVVNPPTGSTPVKKSAKDLKSADLKASPEWFACEADVDCEVVQLSCCDACNGGTEIAINKKSTEAARAAWGETCGEQEACTERGCEPFTAVCVEKVCTPKQGDKISTNPVLR